MIPGSVGFEGFNHHKLVPIAARGGDRTSTDGVRDMILVYWDAR